MDIDTKTPDNWRYPR